MIIKKPDIIGHLILRIVNLFVPSYDDIVVRYFLKSLTVYRHRPEYLQIKRQDVLDWLQNNARARNENSTVCTPAPSVNCWGGGGAVRGCPATLSTSGDTSKFSTLKDF